MRTATETTRATSPRSGPATAAIDPVCGMAVPPYKAAGHLEHDGHMYLFCSTSCRDRFRENPAQYLQVPTGHSGGVLAWLRRVFIGE